MPNTLTNLQDKMISQSAINQLNKIIAPISKFSTSFSSDAAKKGDVINVPNWSTMVAVPFAGDYEAGSDATEAAVPVTINQHIYKSRNLTDVEFANSSANYYEGVGQQLGAALGIGVFQYVASLITATNFGAGAGDTVNAATSVDFKKAEILEARGKLGLKNVPANEAVGILDAAYFTNLLDDAVFLAQNWGSTEAVRSGILTGVYGFESIHETNAIPPNDAGTLKGWFGHRSSLAVAIRTLSPQTNRALEASGVVNNEESGAALVYRRWYSPKAGKMFISMEALMGASKVNNALVRVTGT